MAYGVWRMAYGQYCVSNSFINYITYPFSKYSQTYNKHSKTLNKKLNKKNNTSQNLNLTLNNFRAAGVNMRLPFFRHDSRDLHPP